MTNELEKQCEFFDKGGCDIYAMTCDYYYICKQNEECFVKKILSELKAKEQECEAYKMEAEEGIEINAELKAENERLKEENFTFEQLIKEIEKYGAIEEIIQQLNQLKAELQATKGLVTAISKENFGLIQTQNEIDKKIDKYEIALQEIKEIITKSCIVVDDDDYIHLSHVKQILQKINEVEECL
mgnify:CR=1 FL=1